MKREFKFRAWDKKRKIMIQWEQLKKKSFEDIFSNRDLIVMQYIGIDDENYKEIYEGDIVDFVILNIYKETEYKGVVGIDVYGTFAKVKTKWDDDEFFITEFIEDDTIKVIGNIYENPELLEVQK